VQADLQDLVYQRKRLFVPLRRLAQPVFFDGSHRFAGLPDPLLEPRFRGVNPAHPQHLAVRLAETFGGPAAVLIPADPDFRWAFVAYLEWGTRIALINSQPDAAVIEPVPVPKWVGSNPLPTVGRR
jgi:hypothetical protein